MLIDRYLFRNVFFAAIFVAFCLTAVIWLTQSLKLIELIADSDAPPGVFLKIIALTLPRFLEIILPISFVAGLLFTYNKMIMDNELIVLRACGFDQMMLAKPVLTMATALTLLLLALTTYISPKCYAEMQVLKQSIKTQYSTFLLREGVFNTFGDKMTIYLRDRADNGDLLGLVIHDTRDKSKPPVTVTAKRGRVTMQGDVPNIVVYDGIRQQMEVENKSVSRLSFARYTIEVKGLTTEQGPRWQNASERTFWQLLHPDLTNKQDRRNRKAFLAEAHQRLTAPFNALAFSLTALSFLLLGPFNRRGLTRKVMAAALAVTVLQAASLLVASFARKHPDMLFVLYIVPFVPMVCGFFVLTFRGEQMIAAILRRWRISELKHYDSGVAA